MECPGLGPFWSILQNIKHEFLAVDTAVESIMNEVI